MQTKSPRKKRELPLLKQGNSKLGPELWSFSLPIEKSCKSATTLCSKACYAKSGHFLWDSVRLSYLDAWESAQRGDFADRVVAFCKKKEATVVRIHAAGDFADPAYTRKWVSAASRSPGVKFLAYTRRWRDPEMTESLSELGALDNVHLWLSADAETGEPPRPKWSSGVAYMSLSDSDLPPYPADLVFRDASKVVMRKTPGGVKVCPSDDGVARAKKVTCAACKYCYSGARTPVTGLRTPLPVI